MGLSEPSQYILRYGLHGHNSMLGRGPDPAYFGYWVAHPTRAPPAARYFVVRLAEIHLTRRLFGRILGRIERLAWRPT